MEAKVRCQLKSGYKTSIKQREVVIDLSLAKKIAATFGVDPGVFIGSMVAGVESVV